VRRQKSIRVVRGRAEGSSERGAEADSAVRHWRRDVRPRALRAAVVAVKSMTWSPDLLELLMKEMYVDQSVEEVLDKRLRALPQRRYPQAIAVALILRHSWRADDLAWILRRLNLSAKRTRRET
jgi:hypothetical protein